MKNYQNVFNVRRMTRVSDVCDVHFKFMSQLPVCVRFYSGCQFTPETGVTKLQKTPPPTDTQTDNKEHLRGDSHSHKARYWDENMYQQPR